MTPTLRWSRSRWATTPSFTLVGRGAATPSGASSSNPATCSSLGGAARDFYHGIDRIHPGTSSLLEEGGRFGLTLRRVTRP